MNTIVPLRDTFAKATCDSAVENFELRDFETRDLKYKNSEHFIFADFTVSRIKKENRNK